MNCALDLIVKTIIVSIIVMAESSRVVKTTCDDQMITIRMNGQNSVFKTN